jgi:hypothetical protein
MTEETIALGGDVGIETQTVAPGSNRGTGAGGAATNVNGIAFETKTSNEPRLLASGFERKTIPKCKGKYAYFLEKDNTVFVTQNGLKQYMKSTFGVELFREPDEAYLRKEGDVYILKILEKKNQNVAGSVDSKLGLGYFFISEYKSCLPETFRVEYAFCLSEFLKKDFMADTQKAAHLRKFNAEHKIPVFFGDDEDYFTKLDEWIHS